MDLTIQEVAEELNLSEGIIRRLLTEGKIPAYKINNKWRFSRLEIEEWVMSHKLDEEGPISPYGKIAKPKEDKDKSSKKKELPQGKGGSKQYSLYRALHKGLVLQDVPGTTKEEILKYATKKIAPLLNLDSEAVLELILDRENLMSTAINNGFAIPHTRENIFNGHYDVVAIVFPKNPIDYNALDGMPVHTLFFLFACEDKRHLNLLAKIAHLSTRPDMIDFLRKKPSKDEILEAVKNWETLVP